MTRYTLVSDNDGHHYIIPIDFKDAFYKWLETLECFEGEESTFEDYDKYDEYRVNISGWSFTDPQGYR